MADLFDQPAIVKLGPLLDNVRSGALLIPDFQRAFSWDDEQRLQLLRSIADGLPVGSLLVWSSSDPEVDTLELVGPHALPPRRAQGPWLYLIDGLQRISTLLLALTPPPVPAAGPTAQQRPGGAEGLGEGSLASEAPRRILIDLGTTGDRRFVLER